MKNDTRFLNELPEYRFDGMTRSQAIAAGYEVSDDSLWQENPEAYKDECARRALIEKALRLWEEKAYKWRTVRHEFTFYEDMKRKLKIGMALPSHTQVREWRNSLLLQCGCAGDAMELLRTMPLGQLSSEVSFVENWLKYDCAFNTLTSWVYDMRAKLKTGGVNDSYVGDILDHPEDFRIITGRNTPVVRPIRFGSSYNEHAASAAIY